MSRARYRDQTQLLEWYQRALARCAAHMDVLAVRVVERKIAELYAKVRTELPHRSREEIERWIAKSDD